MESFFNDLNLPTIKGQENSILEAPISEREIYQAVKELSSGKCPGEDGFSIEYYKCFQSELSPLLCKVYNNIVECEEMPISMRLATISVLPKPGKDPLEISSWRPISILNNDYKIQGCSFFNSS